ncbi:MAG: glutaredoxin 2, partial [Pseudomonadota bacterium]
MKLFHYDHCPYCVKARMIFGIKNVPLELETLLNDDEETPISMIGKKMLPILQKEDGSFLPESLDIIKFIDEDPRYGSPVVGPSKNDPELIDWLKGVREYHYGLAMPRWIQMDLEEFKTPAAIQYFTDKKELSIGPFADNMEKTQVFLLIANEHLAKLEKLIVGSRYFWGSELTLDDF